jgi:hypothetical protein
MSGEWREILNFKFFNLKLLGVNRRQECFVKLRREKWQPAYTKAAMASENARTSGPPAPLKAGCGQVGVMSLHQ